MLSGTPIYTDFIDLVYTVNIAAKKQIIPYNKFEFENKFYRRNYTKTVFFGYMLPIVQDVSWLSQNISLMLNLKQTYDIIYKGILPGGDIGNQRDKDLGKAIVDTDFSNIKSIKKIPKLYYLAVMAPSTRYVILMYSFVFIESSLKLLNFLFNDGIYSYLDTRKVSETIRPYVSYYKNSDITFSSEFPTTQRIYSIANYNMYQYTLWIQMTVNILKLETIEKLKMTNKDMEFYAKELDYEDYVAHGLSIGNVYEEKDYSPKFVKILEISKGKRAVFYSSYLENGILSFANFLSDKGIEYLYLDTGISNERKQEILDIFKNSTIFLLLHPKYSEGVSILGAQQIHLLEPVQHLSKKEQIIARVIRYKSHEHLPINERHVDIYQWSCSCEGITEILKKKITNMKVWKQYNNSVLFTRTIPKFSQDMTPDMIVLQKEKTNQENEIQITNYLEKYYKEDFDKGMDCCIEMPSKKQFDNCMKKVNKKCR
jgi:hypothetical protein